MSELIQKNDNRATIRWKLLTGASALALTAYVSSANQAMAGGDDRPQVWIELGGQFSRLQDSQELFAPPRMDVRPSIFDPSQKFEKPPLFNIGEEGKISFQPENSNWIFAASIQYGRSSSNRHVHQQSYPEPFVKYDNGDTVLKAYPYAERFADTVSRNSEQHLIVDFQAGKDVGLGLFGSNAGSSTVSLGVRFAQFNAKTNISLKSDPDWHFKYYTFPSITYVVGQPYHSNLARMDASRSFHGVGPSLSWNASLPFAGNTNDGELTVDWGISAAALFGRQKTRTQHQTTGLYQAGAPAISNLPPRYTVYYNAPPAKSRSRNVTIPNVGGSIGISYRYANAKLSIGYKADFFFNAIDGGIDAAKKEDRGFYGPYASISIGLGD